MKFTKVLLTLFFALLFLLPATVTAASPNFTTDYNVVYTISEHGLTKADMAITLTNTTADHYASSYQMKLGFDDITNLKAIDTQGALKTDLKKAQDGYDLSLTLNKKTLGLGSKAAFHVTFDTRSIVKNNGGIREISIPGIADPTQFNNFTAEIKVPSSFGNPSYIKPAKQDNRLVFTKDELGKSGIAVGFGENQNYEFQLTYHLKNSNLFPGKKRIALPPDTNYQKVYITKITPQPDTVSTDPDGNWLAEYSLKSAQEIDIKVSGIAKIHLTPAKEELSKSEIQAYTKPTRYWQSNDPKIKKLAEELKTADAIYGYVTKTLRYDYKRIAVSQRRLGAVAALQQPDNAVCREFTDLFIGIARAAGIPAREVNGFAYTSDTRERPLSRVQDVLHSWPEYYDTDKETWVMIDPTWGATTGGTDYFSVLDYDHFTFVRKGLDDSAPIPAGGYKLQSGADEKDVVVTPTQNITVNEQSYDIQSALPDKLIAGMPLSAKATIVNNGPGSLSGELLATSDLLSPKAQASENVSIPPYGKKDIEVNYEKMPFLTNKDSFITMRFAEKTQQKKVKIRPFFLIFLQ